MKTKFFLFSIAVLIMSMNTFGQEVNDSIQIKKRSGLGSYSFIQKGKYLNNYQVSRILETDKAASSEFSKARTINMISGGLGFTGSLIAAVGLAGGSLGVGAIGLAVMCVAIPMRISAGKKVEMSILLYNKGLKKRE